MDVKAFYKDLADWVLTINQQAQKLTADEYWNYILVTAGALSKRYKDNPLVKHIIHAHIDFLEKSWKQQRQTA